MYNETGYKLDGEDTVLSRDSFEDYFRYFVRVYTNNSATFVSVEEGNDYFVLKYTVPADYCGQCDEAGIFEGECAHDWEELVQFSKVDLYTFPKR